ncbi:YdcH family protein [Cedecea davisae]|uniref:YdcH family protein n=1 Tax=Cedecea davisae TaxID=158484 RepID=UPI00242B8E03|nr:YdcH family protein [Cedecea davisae]
MFPEYRELISHLKSENPRFLSLFDKHNRLDSEIMRREGPQGTGYNDQVVQMKKEKLRLKDELYQMLKRASLPA